MNLTGATGALKVWTDFIKRIPQHSLSMIKPASISSQWVDTETGLRTDEKCRGADMIPVWGSVDHIDYQRCNSGFSSFGGWFKSWF